MLYERESVNATTDAVFFVKQNAQQKRDKSVFELQDSGELTGPTAWLLGHEAAGLSEQALALADATVRIPLRGRAESLNVSTAAAVCLYASAHAHRS